MDLYAMPPNPLATGFYTISDAARLIEVGNAERIRGWLRALTSAEVNPVLRLDFPPTDGCQDLSFIDLIEVRYVEHFRAQGVQVSALRQAAERFRDLVGTAHPFASARVHLSADGGEDILRVLRETAQQAGDPVLLGLTERAGLEPLIRETLAPGMTFDADSLLPTTWAPRAVRYPDIVMNPRVAYGQPATPGGVPTATAVEVYEAEGRNLDEAAGWLGIPVQEVARAVAFEQDLDRAADARAA